MATDWCSNMKLDMCIERDELFISYADTDALPAKRSELESKNGFSSQKLQFWRPLPWQPLKPESPIMHTAVDMISANKMLVYSVAIALIRRPLLGKNGDFQQKSAFRSDSQSSGGHISKIVGARKILTTH